MKSIQIAVIAILAMAVISSCTKEYGYLKPYNSTDSTGTGKTTTPPGGTGGTADSTYSGTVTNNYQPDSVGSKWTYQVHQVFNFANSTYAQQDPAAVAIIGGIVIDTTITYNVQALGTTTPINGLTYQNYSNDYYGGLYAPAVANSNGSYTGVDLVWEVLWLGGSSFGGFSLNNDTLVYLKEQPSGTTWSEQSVIVDGFGDSDTSNYTFTIKATGLTKTVNNINYPNVIQVESKTVPSSIASYASLFASSGVDVFTTTEYYYAKNVGLIEEDLSEPFMGVTINATLLSSSIK